MTEEQNNKEEIGSKVENVADGDEPKKKALQPLLWVMQGELHVLYQL